MSAANISTVDGLNIFGISAQLIGFIVLAVDLWPEYRKNKKIQMIERFVLFLNYAKKQFDAGNKQNVYFAYGADAEDINYSEQEIRRQWGANYPLSRTSKIYDESSFMLIYDRVINEHQKWIIDISSKRTFRNMYVGEAIFIIIIGYLLQLSAVLWGVKA